MKNPMTTQAAFEQEGWIPFYSSAPEAMGPNQTNEDTANVMADTPLVLVAEIPREEYLSYCRRCGWRPHPIDDFSFYYKAVAE